MSLEKLEVWFTRIFREQGENIYRAKGFLHIHGLPKRVLFQSVQMIYDSKPDRFWNPGEQKQSQLVFIGKNLDEWQIRSGFLNCLAE